MTSLRRKSSHTKGPWKVARLNSGTVIVVRHRAGYYRALIIGDGDNVAEARGRTPEEAQANANLIAAAPELLAAAISLEVAEEAHANCDECDGEDVPELCPKCFPLFDDARLKRRAAIAAAKGGAA